MTSEEILNELLQTTRGMKEDIKEIQANVKVMQGNIEVMCE